MWKVTNKTNYAILDDFRVSLIEPLFTEIINYKSLALNCGFRKYIDYLPIKCPGSKDVLSYINKRKKNKVLFSDLVDNIIKKNTLSKIKKYYQIYKSQNNKISKKDYNIKEEAIDDEFKELFIDFFYEKFFDYPKIWTLIDPVKYKTIQLSRKMFVENFKKENDIEVCPYCDMDTTYNLTNNEIEHFMPKSIFPFLSMNANNLIPSCQSCNKKVDGKGTNMYNPIYSPLNLQMGDNIKFDNNFIMKRILISADNINIMNYIKLLQLDKRYSSTRIYNLVEIKAEAIFDTIYDLDEMSKTGLSELDIINYIEKKCTRYAKKEPLSFALKNIYKKYDLYLDYKRTIC